jgi:hypothetical protein
MLARLNKPNARLGKNWLSRFLDRHPDLKAAHNRGLDSKRIKTEIPSQIEGWFTQVDDEASGYPETPHPISHSIAGFLLHQSVPIGAGASQQRAGVITSMRSSG